MSPRTSEKELLNRLANLPREISPGRDPWPGISAAIGRSPVGSGSAKSRTSRWLLAAAASVLLAVSAGLLLKPLYEESALSTDSLVSSDTVTATVESNVYENASAPGMFNIVDAEYVAAFREFVNAGGSHGVLAPQTVEKIEMGWADLRSTEEALAAALEQNPNDLFLNERMLELRARQLGFLKQLVSLDRNNRRLTI
jgi:hypothetical protein